MEKWGTRRLELVTTRIVKAQVNDQHQDLFIANKEGDAVMQSL